MSNQVYSSNQYLILMELSALLTAAMTDSIFSRTIQDTLAYKINRDNEFIFFLPTENNNYYTSVSAAGILIVNNTIQSPNIALEFNQTTQYTYDKLKNLFYSRRYTKL